MKTIINKTGKEETEMETEMGTKRVFVKTVKLFVMFVVIRVTWHRNVN